jgi:hypothetical protein
MLQATLCKWLMRIARCMLILKVHMSKRRDRSESKGRQAVSQQEGAGYTRIAGQ